MRKDVKGDALKRLAYIQGHLEGVRRMVEEEKYCVDILRQLFAVRRALDQVGLRVLDGHLHTCVVQGIRDARQEEVLKELLELFALKTR